MTLTADQCSALAQIIPVLLLALMLEMRAVLAVIEHARRLLVVSFISAVLSCTLAGVVALIGVADGLSGALAFIVIFTSIWAVAAVTGTMLLSIQAQRWAAQRERRRHADHR